MIYKCEDVQTIQAFYGKILFQKSGQSIYAYLHSLAEKLLEGYKTGHPALAISFANYHPAHPPKNFQEIIALGFSEEDVFQSVASEYGYADWDAVSMESDQFFDLDFEEAIDLMLSGNLKGLKNLIENKPQLINQQSQYPHKATLLHYAATNGTELWRQVVPENLQKIVSFLIDSGIDKRAKMKVYGGEFEALTLLETSAHPYESGLIEELAPLFSIK